jgi:hypothetical protein
MSWHLDPASGANSVSTRDGAHFRLIRRQLRCSVGHVLLVRSLPAPLASLSQAA